MNLRLLASALILSSPMTAFPVSRVGNKIIGDATGGVHMRVDTHFALIEEPADGFARLIVSGFPRRSVNVGEFSSVLPDLALLPRGALVPRLSGAGWVRRPHAEACVESHETTRSGSFTALVSWGSGRGFVFVGKNEPSQMRAVRRTIEALVLPPGACRWK